jgi:iron complex outermembrane recepter protein
VTTTIRHKRSICRANWLVPCVLASAGAMLLASPAGAQDPAPAEDAPAEETAAPEEGAAPAESAPPTDAPADAPGASDGPVAPDPGAVPPVEADIEAEAQAADEPLPEDTGELDEVVVTVDRRAKSLQKYSGTAAAFSERDLARVGIQNLRDIDTKVPGMQIGNQEGNTEIYIRGVGSDNNTELGDPAVAVHLDGIYIPRPRGMGAMFYDIARVEVNSGPQGTLRGRNALGGSVNIVSNLPKLGEYEANAEATFGTYSQRRYQGMVNIPIGESLAFRAAAFSDVHDPWWENAGPIHDIKGPESIDAYSFRTLLKWQPSTAFTALAAFDYTRERGTGWLGANFQGPLTQDDPIAPEDIEEPRRIYNRGQQSSVDMEHWGARLQLNLDAGPVLFEANASYRDMRFQQNNGGNAGVVFPGYGFANDTPDNYGNAYWDQKSNSFVGEIRAFAPDDSRLRWTVGAFLFDEQQDTFLGQTADRPQGFGGGEFPMPETNGDSIAGFADATFDVVETFRILGGIRVTKEHKDRFDGMWSLWTGFPQSTDNANDPVRFGTEGFQYWGTGRTQYELPANHTVEDRVALFLDGIKSFGARDNLPEYLCADPPAAAMGEDQPQRLNMVNGRFQCAFGVHPDLLATDGFGITVVPQNNEVDYNSVDWRAGVEYDLAPDSLLYFTVSTGHKAGGFNDTAANMGLFDSEYDPEDVLAFELGSKNLLADRHLRLNASGFLYRYNNQVFQTIVSVTPPDPDTGMGGSNTAVRDNAATSTMYGLDLDVMYALPAGFEVEVHALLMDARFGEGTIVNDSRLGFDIPQYPVDISDNWLPRVSPLTLTYSLSQAIFTEAGMFDWIISGFTRTQHFMTVFNGEGQLIPPEDNVIPMTDSYNALVENPARLTDVIPAYTRFDIGAGWRHPDSRLSISGYVNNVFDTTYATSIIATPGLNLRFFNPPRTAGVRVRVDW